MENNYTKYLHFSFSTATYIELFLSIAGVCGDIFGRIHGMDCIVVLSIIVAAGSIITLFVHPMINNRKLINKAYPDDLLNKAISKAIQASMYDIDKGVTKNKYRHFLSEMVQAERLNPLYISFDDTAFDDLYDMNGTLSITDAPVFAWKNPEYNWFLLNHYVANLIKRLKNVNNGSIVLEDRNEDGFQDFIKKGTGLLTKISDGCFEYDSFVRFYLLTKNSLQENRALVEQFVAGHELFGINLFLIDKDKVYNDETLKNAFIGIKNAIKEDNTIDSVLDIMVYKKNGEKGYKIGRGGKLENENINDETETACDRFIKDLAKKIIDNKELLLYPVINQRKCSYGINGLKCNKKRTFLNVNENE